MTAQDLRTAQFNRVFAAWQGELLTLGGVSALRDIAALGNTVLNLTTAHPSGIAQLYAGRPTLITSLIRDKAEGRAAGFKAAQVKAVAEAHAARYGLPTTQMSVGIAMWTEEGPDAVKVPRRVPVMLRHLELRETNHGLELELEPTVVINPELVKAFSIHGIPVDPVSLVQDALAGSSFNPAPVLRAVEAMGRAAMDEFELKNKLIVGVFEHPGQALADDLNNARELLAHHPVVAALAGDTTAQQDLLQATLAPMINTDRPPDHERGVGDLTSSQFHVVDVVAEGSSVLINALPTQQTATTLAAVMADNVGSGRSVLYVAGQRRAAQGVARVLRAHGLGEVLLDLEPSPGWQRRAVGQLTNGLKVTAPVLDTAGIVRIRAAQAERAAQINAYLDALHQPVQPFAVSAHDALEAIAQIAEDFPEARTTVHFDTETALQLDAQARAQARAMVEQGARLGMFRLSPADTAWFGAVMVDQAAADQALIHLDRLRTGSLAEAIEQMRQVTKQAGLNESTTMAGWAEQLTMLAGVREALDVFIPEIFERPPDDMWAASAPAEWRATNDQQMSSRVRRRLLKQARDLIRPGLRVEDLHQALGKVKTQREIWLSWTPSEPWPKLPNGMADIEADHAAVRADLDALDQLLGERAQGPLVELEFNQLMATLERLDHDRASLDTLPLMNQLAAAMHQSGLGGLLKDLTNRRVGPVDPTSLEAPALTAAAGLEVDLAWWSSVLTLALEATPSLSTVGGEALAELVASYNQLDVAHVATKPAPIRAAVCAWRDLAIQNYPGQAFKLEHTEATSTLREAIAATPDIALKARPCVLAGPVMVPSAIPFAETGGPVFDLVILDAADSMTPAQAVAAIGRGRQVVVVGDLARGAVGSLTSAAAQVLPQVTLAASGHQRDLRLAELLESLGYQTLGPGLPRPCSDDLLNWHYVDQVGLVTSGGRIDASAAEVEKVVELVIEHLKQQPGESLAVVTASQPFAERVSVALTHAAKNGAEVVAAALEESGGGATAPLVVTDAAGIDTLTPGAVILAPGLARSPRGHVLYDFGQFDHDPGADLLAAVLVACQSRLTVVSSLRATALDDRRLHGAGPVLFKRLLDLAEHAGPALLQLSGPPEGALLADLTRRVERRGVKVKPNYGASEAKKLPLAVGEANRRAWKVAVLSDDAAFVAEPSLRAKLRHWPDQLEAMGWRTALAWSGPVFMDPEAEARNVVQALYTDHE